MRVPHLKSTGSRYYSNSKKRVSDDSKKRVSTDSKEGAVRVSNLAKTTNLTAPIFPRKDRCGEGVQFWPKMFLNEAAFVVYIRCVYTHNTLRMISLSFQTEDGQN